MPELDFGTAAAWVAAAEPASLGLSQQPPSALEHHPEVDAAILRLGQALDRTGLRADSVEAVLTGADGRGDLGRILAQLGSVRVARIIGWVVGEAPGDRDLLAGMLLSPDNPDATYIRACMAAPERTTTLSRVCDLERLKTLADALKVVQMRQGAA